VPGSVSVFLHHSNEEEPAATTDDEKRQTKSRNQRNQKLANRRDHFGVAERFYSRDIPPSEVTKLSDVHLELIIKTPYELHMFVGILLFSGYHSLPRKQLYWCRNEDVNVRFVSSHMAMNRFGDIKKYIHLADNDKAVAGDKLYKVREFISQLNNQFQQFGVFSTYLSVNEEMVPYYGHHTAKMYMKRTTVL